MGRAAPRRKTDIEDRFYRATKSGRKAMVGVQRRFLKQSSLDWG
jgi:hypothetical protein